MDPLAPLTLTSLETGLAADVLSCRTCGGGQPPASARASETAGARRRWQGRGGKGRFETPRGRHAASSPPSPTHGEGRRRPPPLHLEGEPRHCRHLPDRRSRSQLGPAPAGRHRAGATPLRTPPPPAALPAAGSPGKGSSARPLPPRCLPRAVSAERGPSGRRLPGAPLSRAPSCKLDGFCWQLGPKPSAKAPQPLGKRLG